MTTHTKEKPIRLTDAQVRAVLNGSKTQHREPVKEQPSGEFDNDPPVFCKHNRVWCHPCAPTFTLFDEPQSEWWAIPYEVGQRVWVREAFGFAIGANGWDGGDVTINYRADGAQSMLDGTECLLFAELSTHHEQWRPSTQMPSWAARLTLEVTDVRVEQVTSISEEDAKAEGVEPHMVDSGGQDPSGHFIDVPDWITPFAELWMQKYPHGPHVWMNNPWVWVVAFKRVTE